jgi:hypothetical protein
MPLERKLEAISKMSESHTLALTQDAASWANFLDTAARMYKYPFADQVLIHAQRPDATACASMRLWNETFERRRKEGSKAIVLLDDTEPNLRLRYVFDVTDTEGEEPPYVWKMEPEHEVLASEALKTAYEECPDQGDLKSRIVALSKNLVEKRLEDDESNLKEPWVQDIWAQMVASSAGYLVLSRCGLDGTEAAENFTNIARVSDLADICDLGETAGELAKEMLSHVESTVKSYERQKAQQRERSIEQDGNTVSEGRGISLSVIPGLFL